MLSKLVEFMLSGPVVAMVWEGKGAVKTDRKMLGETNPVDSLPGTIRGDYCIDIERNICHGSDSVETAKKNNSVNSVWASCGNGLGRKRSS